MLARKFQAGVLDRAEAKLFRNVDLQEQKHVSLCTVRCLFCRTYASLMLWTSHWSTTKKSTQCYAL